MTTVTGNKRLAEALNVSLRTIGNWRQRGILDKAVISYYGKIIIYDLDKVYQCLNYK